MNPADPGTPGTPAGDPEPPQDGRITPASPPPPPESQHPEASEPAPSAASEPAPSAASERTPSAPSEPAPSAASGPDPSAAQPETSKPQDAPQPDEHQPESHVPARHHGRRKKILAWAGGILAGIVLLAGVGTFLVYRHLNANLHQIDVSGELGSQPVDLHPEAQNILVLGSDTRFDQGRGYGSPATLNTDHSDTLLIVHIAANRKWANVMSIPRDSWVNIPACRMSNGQMSSPTTFKINEAFTIGTLNGNNTDLGTACTIKTVEKDTGIRIDHFVVVNFAGFKDMVKAVDGVPECNTKPINDPKSGLHLSKGHHVLNGRQALGYVRARYTLGNGSDLERITRQQAFMSSLVARVKSKLLNPLAIYRFLDAATKSLTIDSQLGGIRGLYNLAMSVRNLPPSRVTFFTLPTYPRSYVDPTDTADVMWTQPQASLIFQAFRNDVPVSKALLKHPATPQLSPHTVAVRVLNGSGTYGLESTVAAALTQEGFKVTGTGVATSQTVTETVIRYHKGQEQKALLLASKVHGAGLLKVSGHGRPTLLLGSNYGTTAHTGPGGTTPQPASSFKPRTATQNICT
jgi:LCP family protein required for cell wall assembly